MKRFFFDLEGKQSISDPGGLLLHSELQALRAAQRLAAELANSRPDLRGNTSVVVTAKDERATTIMYSSREQEWLEQCVTLRELHENQKIASGLTGRQ